MSVQGHELRVSRDLGGLEVPLVYPISLEELKGEIEFLILLRLAQNSNHGPLGRNVSEVTDHLASAIANFLVVEFLDE